MQNLPKKNGMEVTGVADSNLQDLIEAGKVMIDGRTAVLGDKVNDSQRVTVNGREVTRNDELILLALNKPEGIECTTDASNPDNIVDFIHYP